MFCNGLEHGFIEFPLPHLEAETWVYRINRHLNQRLNGLTNDRRVVWGLASHWGTMRGEQSMAAAFYLLLPSLLEFDWWMLSYHPPLSPWLCNYDM